MENLYLPGECTRISQDECRDISTLYEPLIYDPLPCERAGVAYMDGAGGAPSVRRIGKGREHMSMDGR